MSRVDEVISHRYPWKKNTLLFFVAVALSILACGCSNGQAEEKPNAESSVVDAGDEDLSIALFQKDHIVEVKVEMAETDWKTLRREARSVPAAWSSMITKCEPEIFDYTYFDATVTVDGETIENVGIRKKGYLGSLSMVKPSLKINFGKFVPDQRSWGMKRLTLNNDRQDISHTHQCIAYNLFRQAGIAAPRCNFARVWVNGKELGIYTHVESIKKPFLARHFSSNDGNLYEGWVSDFKEPSLDRFDVKTNKKENDRSDLKALITALEVSDEALYDELDKLVDLDAFFSFWAVEVLVGHWDGLTGDNNNFFMYNDPETKKFYFIPWGTDGTFTTTHAFLPDDLVPASVYAYNSLAYRLYNHLPTRQMYHERLKKLIDTFWNVDSLLEEVDRIGALTSSDPDALENTREYIRTRGENILAELKGDGPSWVLPPVDDRPECRLPTEVSGSFAGTWSGDISQPTSPTDASLDITLDNEPVDTPPLGYFLLTGLSEFDASALTPDSKMIGIVGIEGTSNRGVMLWIEPSLYGAGKIPFHGFETGGQALAVGGVDSEFEQLGFIGNGSITLDEAGTEPGEPVSGTFSARFFELSSVI